MQKYQYEFVSVNGSDIMGGIKDHREIIEKYSKKGYRFVTVIPTKLGRYDLVFEKESN